VATVALLVLAGWAFGVQQLTQLVPGLVAMNPVTAVCLLLSATALAANSNCIISRAAASGAVMITAVKLLEPTVAFPISVDQLLFRSTLTDPTGVISRMAPNTALALALLGSSVLAASKPTGRMPLVSQMLAALAALIALFAIIGYVLSIGQLYGVGHFIPMALHTALCLVVLAACVISLHPHRGFTKILLNKGPAGSLARTALPLALFVPVVVGFVRLIGQQAGFYGTETGIALQVIANVLLTFCLLSGAILALYRADLIRLQREVDSARSKERYRLIERFEQEEANALLEALAATDPLTGLSNRRLFDERLQAEWQRMLRNGQSFALVAIDIDWFKKYNDCFGHPAGDDCLKQAADAIAASCRSIDFAARLGGEEFGMLLPEVDAGGAAAAAERVRGAIERLGLEHPHGEGGLVTISVGVALGSPLKHADVSQLICAADRALYRAKAGGRNRVSMSADANSSSRPALRGKLPLSMG
jgi:diguanylate cyclase (GGDEF)-like protein